MDSIGIALIGYGMIGRVHSLAYHELPIFYPGGLPRLRLVGVCTSRPETARTAAAAAGYASWCTDYRELLARDDVNVIDCSTPNHTHKPLILDAMRAGKHVDCEKPLALDGAEARTMLAATSCLARLGSNRAVGVGRGQRHRGRRRPGLGRRRAGKHGLGPEFGYRESEATMQ